MNYSSKWQAENSSYDPKHITYRLSRSLRFVIIHRRCRSLQLQQFVVVVFGISLLQILMMIRRQYETKNINKENYITFFLSLVAAASKRMPFSRAHCFEKLCLCTSLFFFSIFSYMCINFQFFMSCSACIHTQECFLFLVFMSFLSCAFFYIRSIWIDKNIHDFKKRKFKK